jgi:hypothetical protein
VASTPTNAADAAKFQLQPWEVGASGLHAVTRQELNLPLDTGYYKFVPFISGEAGKWGEDVNGQDITRLTGQAGLRSSLPMVKYMPDVQSSVLNLNGLAHKITFESEFIYADTTQDLNLFPLYNPIDDNAQEHFRRRLVFNTFGGVLPAQFDATNFAARQALQRYMSAGASEIVANQAQSRFGIHQRFQTKRGIPGRERIADVVEFDVDAIFFAGDVLAVGALFEAQRRGWKVPDRIALAGFDDLDIHQHTVPKLTCLRLPRLEIGRRSAEALLARLRGGDEAPRVDLGFEVIQREST